MIPKNTQPGTLVVCIRDEPNPFLPEAKLRQVYTLAQMTENLYGNWVVQLEETLDLHQTPDPIFNALWAYPAEIFELAVLPKVLRECFERAPGDDEIRLREDVK